MPLDWFSLLPTTILSPPKAEFFLSCLTPVFDHRTSCFRIAVQIPDILGHKHYYISDTIFGYIWIVSAQPRDIAIQTTDILKSRLRMFPSFIISGIWAVINLLLVSVHLESKEDKCRRGSTKFFKIFDNGWRLLFSRHIHLCKAF